MGREDYIGTDDERIEAYAEMYISAAVNLERGTPEIFCEWYHRGPRAVLTDVEQAAGIRPKDRQGYREDVVNWTAAYPDRDPLELDKLRKGATALAQEQADPSYLALPSDCDR